MIYVEPNEVQEGTIVHPSLIRVSVPLPGLEEKTGADFLIDPAFKPEYLDDTFLAEASARGMLIQRKHGEDLTNSIRDQRLFDAGKKMRRWTDRPWLTVIGSLYATDDGNCKIGPTQTNWTFSSVSGALDWWQDPDKANGGVSFVRLEKDFAKWMISWEKRLIERAGRDPEEEKIDYQIQQPDPFPEEWAWLSTLQTFPTIGRKKAIALGRAFGTLADVLYWMSNPQFYKTADPDVYPEGIGIGTIMQVRKWLGLGKRDLTFADVGKAKR